MGPADPCPKLNFHPLQCTKHNARNGHNAGIDAGSILALRPLRRLRPLRPLLLLRIFSHSLRRRLRKLR